MLRSLLGASAAVLLLGCPTPGDLTMPPPPEVDAEAEVEVPPPRPDGRLPEGVEPAGYELDLQVDPTASSFEGEARIDVRLERPTEAVVLHASGLAIQQAEVVRGDERIAAEATHRKAAGGPDEPEELVVVPAERLEPGRVRLRLAYEGPLGTALQGIYRVEEGGSSYVFTQLEPSDARRMFPSFDDPVYKVPFTLTVTAPAEDAVFTNTPEVERTELDDGRIRHRFAESKPMPTYLVALAVGPLEVLEGPEQPVPMRVVAARGRAEEGRRALRMAGEQLGLLSDYFGEPYPYAKLDLVAVPNFGAGAMENAGLITFREELLLVDGEQASAKARRDAATILGHELAHHWFGNLVTMRWWDDLWLNEGFATLMEAWVVDRQKPELRAGLELVSAIGQVMDFDALPSARRVRQPVRNTYEAEEAFDGITYIKGAGVLRMLEAWIGEEAFRDGVRRYLTKHRWAGASAEDLFSALASASGREVGAVASSFVDQTGVPLVRAELQCGEGAPVVRLSQRRYQPRPDVEVEPRRWTVPVCVAHGSSTDASPERSCTLLRGGEAELALGDGGCPAWVLPNAGYAGYYRYALEPEALGVLAEVAHGGGALGKVGFLSNLWALVQSGEVGSDTLFEQLRRFRSPESWAVVEQIRTVLEHVSDALVRDPSRRGFQRLVTTMLEPTAKRLGFEPQPGEGAEERLLRREVLLTLASFTDSRWMAREAKERARAWLSDPASVEGDPTIALRLAAHRGDLELEALKRAHGAADEPRRRIALVEAMGSLGDPEALREVLAMVERGEIRAQDLVYVARAATAHSDTRSIFVSWLESSLSTLSQRIPGFAVARLFASARRICDREARDRAERELMPVARRIGVERRLREALDQADQCIDLARRQGGAASDALARRRR